MLLFFGQRGQTGLLLHFSRYLDHLGEYFLQKET